MNWKISKRQVRSCELKSFTGCLRARALDGTTDCQDTREMQAPQLKQQSNRESLMLMEQHHVDEKLTVEVLLLNRDWKPLEELGHEF